MRKKIAKSAWCLFLLGFIITACSGLNTDWGPDYDITKRALCKRIKQFTFYLRPLPTEKLMEINYGSKKLSNEERSSIAKEYRGFKCFVFEIGIDGFNGKLADYNAPNDNANKRIKDNYYLFDMQSDLKLKDLRGGEIPCAIFYSEGSSSLVGTNRFIVGFQNTEESEMVFEYGNPHLNCGKVLFNLNKQLLAVN